MDDDILAQAISSILPMAGSDVDWDDIMMLFEDEPKVTNIVKEAEECTSASLDIIKALCDNLPPKESTSTKKMLLDEEFTLASLESFGPEYIECLDEEDVKVLMIKIGKFLNRK